MKHVLGGEKKVDKAEAPSVICILGDKEKKAKLEMKSDGWTERTSNDGILDCALD